MATVYRMLASRESKVCRFGPRRRVVGRHATKGAAGVRHGVEPAQPPELIAAPHDVEEPAVAGARPALRRVIEVERDDARRDRGARVGVQRVQVVRAAQPVEQSGAGPEIDAEDLVVLRKARVGDRRPTLIAPPQV